MEFIPFTAATRMSGVNYEGNEIRKGAADSVRTYVEAAGGVFSKECDEAVERIAKAGGTPLVVTKNCRVLGVVYLKDIIKSGVKEKFADLRKMGIKTIMVTGDNPLTPRQSPPRPVLMTSWPRPPLKASSRRSASSSVRATWSP